MMRLELATILQGLEAIIQNLSIIIAKYVVLMSVILRSFETLLSYTLSSSSLVGDILTCARAAIFILHL
jgi:hypothetical protein